ncbi:phenylacetate-CoA ligase [Eubacterium ruminantium]|nr:phenylacetate-CoA ligase [Eubacterium ruminantium]
MNWPVVNKSIIRSQYDSFISDVYEKDQLITMSTSGSTGTPFVSYQNEGKKKSVKRRYIVNEMTE